MAGDRPDPPEVATVTVEVELEVDGELELTLAELCRACQVTAEQLLELVSEGIVEPLDRAPESHWRFAASSVWRVRSALHLARDLGVNWAGAALALDLIEELRSVRSRLRRYDD
ncbi:MAG: MerR family transcriptional regulator [Gammaproteobacteria bacterium]|nr:MerR family transcriptional regulator [Gammaproteobacteria bacterium]